MQIYSTTFSTIIKAGQIHITIYIYIHIWEHVDLNIKTMRSLSDLSFCFYYIYMYIYIYVRSLSLSLFLLYIYMYVRELIYTGILLEIRQLDMSNHINSYQFILLSRYNYVINVIYLWVCPGSGSNKPNNLH